MHTEIPTPMRTLIERVKDTFSEHPKVGSLFEQCFTNTLHTTIKRSQDGTTFIVTGDIPAMWLRDSTAQVRPYLILAEDDQNMADLIEGVVKRQFRYILHDPYANAFNEFPNGRGYQDDLTQMSPLVWERKYEVDSLCYPIQLAYLLWKSTGKTTHFDETFQMTVRKIIEVWRIEQHHEGKSTYLFQRRECRSLDTLTREGKADPAGYTGMTWSGFRPSDDACRYGYSIPANMFAVVALRYLVEIEQSVLHDIELSAQASDLADEIERGIETYGRLQHPDFGTVYGYETDGLGHYVLMDDANVPSLLSIPYLGYRGIHDSVYQNTRRLILSGANPYFYKGNVASGIGSPHTPVGYVWHIALAMQGITSTSTQEMRELIDTLALTDGGTGMMHEGFDVDNPNLFTREWFSWANMMFCEFVLYCCGAYVKGAPIQSRVIGFAW